MDTQYQAGGRCPTLCKYTLDGSANMVARMMMASLKGLSLNQKREAERKNMSESDCLAELLAGQTNFDQFVAAAQ